jgi:hypothetical protein
MRVVFVGQSGASAGGAERSLQLLLSHLPKQIEVRVILFEDGSFAQELRGRGFEVDVIAPRAEVMAVQRERLRLSTAFGAVSMMPRLIASYRHFSADVVYTNTVKAHILGAIAGRLGGFRVVMHLRDILSGPARMLLRVVGFACTQQRIAISKAVSEALALPKTITVPNPIDLRATGRSDRRHSRPHQPLEGTRSLPAHRKTRKRTKRCALRHRWKSNVS